MLAMRKSADETQVVRPRRRRAFMRHAGAATSGPASRHRPVEHSGLRARRRMPVCIRRRARGDDSANASTGVADAIMLIYGSAVASEAITDADAQSKKSRSAGKRA
jgi:hypothetical protein